MASGTYEKLTSVVSVVAALAVLVRGNVWAALILFGVGLWLLGRGSRLASGRRTHLSRVRSAMIEMDFDQARATMTGRIIAGRYEGNALDRLDRAQCETVYRLCRRDDPDGARLLEAYLDRRFAGWRPAGQGDADAGRSRPRSASRMSEDEAYEVLGLRRGAARDEIVRAHRTVMKKWHPDQGGTADLAARANEAKEVLLRRHA
jgi:DnaJ-domain-containing protein 1